MADPTQTPFTSIHVSEVFDSYPDALGEKLLVLRQLIFDTASEMGVDDLDETLKWGEPSYLTKNGSTIRVAWRKSKPNQYGLFFNCKTSLIETFRELYRDSFTFEGNRAIVFTLDDTVPTKVLEHCIQLSLRYHCIKQLPMLGV